MNVLKYFILYWHYNNLLYNNVDDIIVQKDYHRQNISKIIDNRLLYYTTGLYVMFSDPINSLPYSGPMH